MLQSRFVSYVFIYVWIVCKTIIYWCHKYCLCLCVWDTLCDIYLNCFWGWLMVVHWILLMNYLGCLCINNFFVKALWLYLSIQFLDFDMNLCVLLARCLCCLFLNVTSIVCLYVCGIHVLSQRVLLFITFNAFIVIPCLLSIVWPWDMYDGEQKPMKCVMEHKKRVLLFMTFIALCVDFFLDYLD